MSHITAPHLNAYASYSPKLQSVKLVANKKPNSGLAKFSLGLMACGILVASTAFGGLSLLDNRAVVVTPTPIVTSHLTKTESTKSTQTIDEPSVTPAAATNLPDSSALQAVLDTWLKDNPNDQFGVVVTELNGAERSANLSAHKSFPAASLYKAYLATYLYDLRDRGSLSFDQVLTGMPGNIDYCLRQMIVVSNNECGQSLGMALGWPSLHNYVRGLGLSETVMSPVNTTTAYDVASFLAKFERGSVTSNAKDKQQLLGYMKTQVFRSGIPAGMSGTTVADKVGLKPSIGLYHDAAIVYGPKSTYVMVVLSTNSSTTAIKDLASRVSKFLNQ